MKTLLFKPFERYSETVLLTVGLIVSAIGIVLATWFHARFDGAIDLHFSAGQSYARTTVDLVVDFLSLLVFLYPFALWVNRKTRFVDMCSTILIAKIPMYLLILFNANESFYRLGQHFEKAALQHEALSLGATTMLVFIAFVVVAILLLVWSITLLYNGYKTASNARGAKAVVLFIAALLLGEILSQLLLYQIGIAFPQL